jgi:phage gpG-like protein
MTSPISLSGSQLSGAVGLKFNVGIAAFDFRPSIGLVAKNLNALAFELESFKEPLTRSVERVIIPSIRTNFVSGGRPAWEPLAPETVARRGAIGPILIRSGALESAATSKDIWTITKQAAVVKSLPADVWYGVLHQGGFSGGGGSFGRHVAAATSLLGRGASPMEVIRTAFAIMDEATGGARGQQGAGITIPARPFIMYQEQDADAIQDVFSEWVGEQIIKHWVASGL